MRLELAIEEVIKSLSLFDEIESLFDEL